MKRITFVKLPQGDNRTNTLGTIGIWMQAAANGEYTITMERVRKQRTISQNQLMWLWFKCIAEAWTQATGYVYTKDDVHDAYCMLFLPVDTPKGRIAGRTKGLTTEQMTDFLNRVQADAATEYGITLPHPEDQFFEAWANEYADR